MRKSRAFAATRSTRPFILTVASFVPFATEFDRLSDYLVAKAKGHAGFMLSTQLAATILNLECGPFSDFALMAVDQREDGKLILLPDMIAGAVGLLSNPLAGQTTAKDKGAANKVLRALILACTGEFSSLNSSAGDSAFVPLDVHEEFEFPYPGEI